MLNRETMSIEEYENGENTKNHYNREERLSRKRDYDGEFPNSRNWSFFSFLKSKKKRKALSFFHLGLLILVVVLFFGYNAIDSYFFSGNDSLDGLSIKLATIDNEDDINKGVTLYIFISNQLEDDQILNFSTVPELYLIMEEKIVYKEKLSISKTINLSPKDTDLNLHYNDTFSYSEKINLDESIDYEKIRVIFDIKGKEKIVIEEQK